MKYCNNCRKAISALGVEGITLCMAAGHEIIDVTFEDLYKSAVRRSERKR